MAAINLVTCFLDPYVVFISSIFISAGEPLNAVFCFFTMGEPLNAVFCFFTTGEPLNTLFFIFPPVVLLAAEGLGYTVHRLTEGDGNLFVLATILVLPRGDQ